ncbi:hypothetical protein N431DRAFT_128189 [Stipitochalara longipes BDJ]|nr:hypothetical protein N431DRAFT_128189 [Stipitochalara longipes BDJ]
MTKHGEALNHNPIVPSLYSTYHAFALLFAFQFRREHCKLQASSLNCILSLDRVKTPSVLPSHKRWITRRFLQHDSGHLSFPVTRNLPLQSSPSSPRSKTATATFDSLHCISSTSTTTARAFSTRCPVPELPSLGPSYPGRQPDLGSPEQPAILHHWCSPFGTQECKTNFKL